MNIITTEEPRFAYLESIEDFAKDHPDVRFEIGAWKLKMSGPKTPLLYAWSKIDQLDLNACVDWKSVSDDEISVGYY